MRFTDPELDEPQSDFPNRLADPASADHRHPLRVGWVLAIVALTLAPRAMMAWKLDVLCPDGVVYIESAAALDRGDLKRAFGEVGTNTYPIILSYLHGMGLGWEQAGKVWGVSMATLAVLPLIGWLRRQFNDRVALAAGFLYAVHPKLIEWSPELVRDQTFWLLASLTLYLGWRAAAEARVRWYLLAGVSLVLALYTRFEAWFLIVPLACWSAWRLAEAGPSRVRVAIGIVCLTAVVPAAIVAAESAWLAEHPELRWGPLMRFRYVTTWYRAMADGLWPQAASDGSVPPAIDATPAMASATASTASTGALEAAAAAPVDSKASNVSAAPPAPLSAPAAVMATTGNTFTSRMPTHEAVWLLLHTLERGLNVVYGALMAIGLWRGRGALWRRDRAPLFIVAGLVLVGMWIHLWNAQATSSRYVLLIVLLLSPYASIGLLQLAAWWAARPAPRSSTRRFAWATVYALVALVGLIDALSSSELGRRREAGLGRWLLATFGRQETLIVTGHMNVLRHYAESSSIPFPADADVDRALNWLAGAPADLMVLSRKRTPASLIDALTSSRNTTRFTYVEHERIPEEGRDVDLLLFVRASHDGRVASALRAATQ